MVRLNLIIAIHLFVVHLRDQNTFSSIKCINLAYCKVGDLSSFIKLKQFSRLVELDLEGNLIDSWQEVMHVINGLDSIQIANFRYIF